MRRSVGQIIFDHRRLAAVYGVCRPGRVAARRNLELFPNFNPEPDKLLAGYLTSITSPACTVKLYRCSLRKVSIQPKASALALGSIERDRSMST
jgi:hypothetical protein